MEGNTGGRGGRSFARVEALHAATMALQCLLPREAGGPRQLAGEGLQPWLQAGREARNAIPLLDWNERSSRDACGGLVSAILPCCNHVIHQSWQGRSGEDSKLPTQSLLTMLQVLGNAAASHESMRDRVWEQGWPSPLLDMALADTTSSCKSVIAMIVFNVLKNNSAASLNFVQSEEGGQLLSSLLKVFYHKQEAPLSPDELNGLKDLGEWLQLIMEELMSQGHLVALHQRMGTMPSSGNGDAELLFWYLLDDSISNAMQDVKDTQEFHELCPLKLQPQDYAYLATELGLIFEICLDCARRGRKYEEVTAMKLRQVMHVIASSLSFESASIRASYRDKGLLHSCVNLLKSLSHAQALKTEMGLKRDVIRILANMCYRDQPSQDLVRELGGIPLILEGTNIDDNNPFSREWSVLAVRNLCEGNEQNQRIIAGIQPQQVASVPQELRDRGINVTLDNSTGKVKVVRDDAEREVVEPPPRPHAEDEEDAPRAMVEELKDMGLRANVSSLSCDLRPIDAPCQLDEDTGLVEISHPDAKPSSSVYHKST
eukprot:172455-Hanusia_phi.AAC.3